MFGKHSYRGLVADDEPALLHPGGHHHLGAFDSHDALKARVAGLRVRQVVHLQADLLLHVVRQQNAILRVEETRAEVGAVRRQMRWILDAHKFTLAFLLPSIIFFKSLNIYRNSVRKFIANRPGTCVSIMRARSIRERCFVSE